MYRGSLVRVLFENRHFSLVGTYNDVQWRGQYINEWPIYRLLSVRKSKEKSYEIFWQVSSKFFEFLISKKKTKISSRKYYWRHDRQLTTEANLTNLILPHLAVSEMVELTLKKLKSLTVFFIFSHLIPIHVSSRDMLGNRSRDSIG